MDSLSNFFEKTVKSTPPTIPFGVVACTLIYQTTFLEVAVYIYTLVFKKVDISKIYISFASLRETKQRVYIYIFIYISEMSTFLKTRAYILSLYIKTGAHQMEPPSPIQDLGVNPFPSRFLIRTGPRGDFARRRWEEPITTTK